MRTAGFVLLVAVMTTLAIAGCGEEDLTSVRFNIEAGGKGKLVATIIRVRDVGESPLSKSASGLEWKSQELAVVVQEASFDDISKAQIAGISASVSGNSFKLKIPLGKDAQWTKVLAASEKDIEVVKKLNSQQKMAIPQTIGSKFKFSVRLPGEVLAKGCTPKIAQESSAGLFGVGSEEAKKEATLVLPLKKVASSTEKELVWEVTWKE
jgi:hypothetical protein